jgi:hypothetical protein
MAHSDLNSQEHQPGTSRQKQTGSLHQAAAPLCHHQICHVPAVSPHDSAITGHEPGVALSGVAEPSSYHGMERMQLFNPIIAPKQQAGWLLVGQMRGKGGCGLEHCAFYAIDD